MFYIYVQGDIIFFAGGLDSKVQEAALRKGPDIVIATPGRLVDHLHNTPSFSLQTVEIIILDEADRYTRETSQSVCLSNRQTKGLMTDWLVVLLAYGLVDCSTARLHNWMTNWKLIENELPTDRLRDR